MFDNDKINLKKLSDAGVRIVFGTDCGGAADRYFIQGFFEHRQMELMRRSRPDADARSSRHSRKTRPRRSASTRISER